MGGVIAAGMPRGRVAPRAPRGVQNPPLCPVFGGVGGAGNWGLFGGSKKAQFSPIYFGWFHPEASGLPPSLFLDLGKRTPSGTPLFRPTSRHSPGKLS